MPEATKHIHMFILNVCLTSDVKRVMHNVQDTQPSETHVFILKHTCLK